MTNKETILKTIDFIESNLTSDINVSDIAKEGCYSLYHFTRLFQNIAGISPKKYLLQRRLTESVRRLRNSKDKIAAIAFDFQFGSNEVFSRTFRRRFGINPSNVRKGGTIPAYLLTRAITEDFIFQSKKARNQEPDLIELKEKMLVGTSYFIKGNLKKLDLSKEWNSFMKEVDLINNKMIPEYYYQIQYWSENQDLEGLNFFIGVEVNSIKEISPQFVIKTIPKGTYLRVIHQGLSRNVRYTYRYIYNEFLPDTNYKLSKPFNFEYYGENYLSPNDEQSESHLFIPVSI
ncbi:AraC family transcriptional regulator [Flagellimonas sp. HMM57]|uniref:AraC family transcriptional regulator n=1 Tax=unclassified Flagellimonas TaxID=2644544 RepID=UPI0013D1DF59|nr:MULTISPECIES: AraC family transcriptional regulator [unclassified Flagellimonas]UII77838.1 AraC family transcriptional regulator [Flagellimonas sp. HMM57]